MNIWTFLQKFFKNINISRKYFQTSQNICSNSVIGNLWETNDRGSDWLDIQLFWASLCENDIVSNRNLTRHMFWHPGWFGQMFEKRDLEMIKYFLHLIYLLTRLLYLVLVNLFNIPIRSSNFVFPYLQLFKFLFHLRKQEDKIILKPKHVTFILNTLLWCSLFN